MFITDVDDVVHILPYSLVLKYFTHVFRKPKILAVKKLLIFVTVDIRRSIIKWIFWYCQSVFKTLFYVFTKYYVNWSIAFFIFDPQNYMFSPLTDILFTNRFLISIVGSHDLYLAFWLDESVIVIWLRLLSFPKYVLLLNLTVCASFNIKVVCLLFDLSITLNTNICWQNFTPMSV